MSTKETKLRPFDKIPIFIVENHNEVLEFIYRCLGSRHLPFNNNTMIHFDSHPDMTVSRTMPSEYVFNKEKLLADVSIENWIMPTCFAGHFSQLVWMKPYWATQIKDNDYQFLIGDYCGHIRVNSTLEYFLSEASYRPESELSQSKLIDLKVRTLSDDLVGHSDLLPSNSGVYVLDIDLDFFSTHNPFLKIYDKADVYTKLHKIFAFSWPDKGEQTDELLLAKVKERESQLDELEKAFQYVAEHGSLDEMIVPEILKPVWSHMVELVADVQGSYSDVNWTLIYDAGCTCDNTDLPHHESSVEEINQLIDQFKKFLRELHLPPTIVTISRSSYDDYCPVDQVELIQTKVLNALHEVYGDRITNKPILDYEDEEWKI